MTPSVITTPNQLSPVNSEIWFRIDSASSSATDFKYLTKINYKVEPFDTTSFSSLSVYKLPPRPITGECQFTPNRPLRSIFTYENDPFNVTGWVPVNSNLLRFNLNFGFEYNPALTFSATGIVGGKLTLTFPSSTPIRTGDIIRIDKDNKQINAYYDGTCSVLSEVGNGQIVRTSVDGGIVVLNESGDITLLQRFSGTTSNFEAYNGTRQYLERTRNFGDDFIFGTVAASDYFLTNYRPATKPIFLYEYETASMILATTSGYSFNIEKFNSSGSSLGATAFTLSKSNKYKRMDFPVGTQNIRTLTGSQSYFNGVDNYNYWVEWDEAVTISWLSITPPFKVLQTTLYPTGTYNTKPYFVWSDAHRTYYLWWSSLNSWWEVSSALGGGNSWLTSVGAGLNNLPPEGSRPTEWVDGQDAPMFTIFILTTGLRVSEIRNMKINQNCSIYDTVRLVWLNRAGGWDYFSFTKDSKKTLDIERFEFTKMLNWNYNVGDRGDTIFAQQAQINYFINSDWITEEQSVWLEELFTSPEVYHLSGTNKLPIIITDRNYEVKTYLRNQIFNLQLSYKYSYNINLQNQ